MPRHRQDIGERFYERVRPGPGCWLWAGRCDHGGYGVFKVGRKPLRAHRVAWEMRHGPIPGGMQIDHVCNVPACVNVDHLRVVTPKQNTEHRAANSRNTSGYRGVAPVPSGRWVALVQGRHLGTFDTPEEAAEVARQERLRVFTHNDLDKASS